MHQKRILAAAVVLLLASTAATATTAPASAPVAVPDTLLPALVSERAEAKEFDTRGIHVGLPTDPFLEVKEKNRAGASSLRAATAARLEGRKAGGQGGFSVEDTVERPDGGTVPGSGSEAIFPTAQNLPDFTGIPKVASSATQPAPQEAAPVFEPPAHHVLKPGTPVAVQQTLSGAIRAKEEGVIVGSPTIEPEPPASPPVKTPVVAAKPIQPVKGLAVGLPTATAEPQPELKDGEYLTIPSANQVGLVDFDMLKPATWKPAYDAYLAPHVSPQVSLIVGGLILLIAFVLGRAVASNPNKVRA